MHHAFQARLRYVTDVCLCFCILPTCSDRTLTLQLESCGYGIPDFAAFRPHREGRFIYTQLWREGRKQRWEAIE